MIPLLDDLDRWEREACLKDDPEHRRALRLLEWHRVAAQVARHARCRRTSSRLSARLPFVDPDPIAFHRALADELRTEGDRGEWPPLVEVSDALTLLECDPPWSLEGPDLVHLAGVAADLDRLRVHLADRARTHPRWAAAAADLVPLDGFVAGVERVLDRDGIVRDDASPQLARLRGRARDLERQARSVVRQAMSHAHAAGWTGGPEPTLRGDRLCLPIRAGAKRRVDGLVHDRSASGGTLYIEPAAAVPLQNDLVEARLAVAAEIARLLADLNRAAERAAPDLGTAAALALRVDEIRSALLWSRAVRGARPALGEAEELDLRSARHPLLAAREEEPVVPLDVALAAPTRVLMISGPNAGGKSVALKCVGLMVLLAQCGWDVPAREDTRLPLVRRICVELGDDQSIARSLSSFSAHLSHLAGFVAAADASTLALCDEIDAGTDPDEGAALAFAVLEELAARGARVLASTHSGLLKAAVADHPAMANAAMDFDERSLRPLFTLRAGMPGASHAFAIAGRLDFPPALLERARARVGEERFRIENLLAELGARARAAAERESEAERLAAAARRDREELDARLAGIAAERDRVLEETRADGEAFLADARRTLERVVRELRGGGAGTRAIRDARRDIAALGEGLPEAPRRPAPRPPEAGDRVRVPHLGLAGNVVEVRGGRLVVMAGGMRLTLPLDAVVPSDAPAPAAAPEPGSAAVRADPAGGGGAQAELDLRGCRADEGWEILDRVIDRAIPTGMREIAVIHGHGTGRLRAHLWERLRRDPRVAACEESPPEQGGLGRTIVRLA